MPKVLADKAFRDGFSRRLRQAVAENWDGPTSGLAEVLCRRRNVVYRWLSGKSMPEVQGLLDICETLDVSADWLLGLEGR